MSSLRTFRFRVTLLAIFALLHSLVVPLNVHARHWLGGDSEWGEICTASGAAVLVRVDASSGEIVTAPPSPARERLACDDHCKQCLKFGGSAPALSTTSSVWIARVAVVYLFEDNQSPDRPMAWSAEGSRAPPL